MNKEKLRKYFQRFCHWQQTVPHYANRHEGEVQHCHNCDSDFSGNFCPICSQRAEVGRVGWQSIKDNIAILWGMDSRSLGYSCCNCWDVQAIWCATTSVVAARYRFRQ